MASLYREAQQRYAGDEEGLYAHLREHRLSDPSICLGYYLARAARELNRNQADVAGRTGTASDPPISRGFLSQVLSGESTPTPQTWVRLARATDANPLEFFLAMGWLDPGDIAVYQLPFNQYWAPIAPLLQRIPPGRRDDVVQLVKALIETLIGKL